MNWKLNNELNNVADYFTERCRVHCVFKNNISPLQYWNNNKVKIREQYKTVEEIRENLYYNANFCNNFNISFAIAVLKLLKAKKWLFFIIYYL